jgi:hypothetical protein
MDYSLIGAVQIAKVLNTWQVLKTMVHNRRRRQCVGAIKQWQSLAWRLQYCAAAWQMSAALR